MNLEIHNFTQNEVDNNLFTKAAKETLKYLEVKDNTEISLALVGDGRIRRLNKMYRGKNRATDVLSFGEKSVMGFLKKAFPKLRKDEEEFILPPDNISRLGEIVICLPQAKKQAKKQGHSLEKELTILMVHGLLHLLGYDHEENEEQAKKMQATEENILKSLN